MSTWRFFWLPLVFISSQLWAQKPKEYIRLGEEAELAGRADEAFACYEKAWLLDSTDFDVAVHYAESARDMKYYRLAAHLFDKIYEKDKGKVYVNGQYELARMQQMMGWYEDAYRNFVKYYRKQKQKEGYQKECERHMLACEWAINYRPPKDTLPIFGLGPGINTDESEIAPFVNGDHLYFSSTQANGHYWEIFECTYDSSGAGNAELWNPLRNSGINQANAAFDASGERLFYSREGSNQQATAIYTARISPDGISGMTEIKSLNEKGAGNTMPHVASISNQQYLFFASDRAGGQGGMDIWYCEINGDEFSAPVNAGKQVNSAGNEITPFVYNNELYFSSDWLPGFGGFDIFHSRIENGMNFGNAQNFGIPFSSAQNDLYPAFFSEISKGFLASNREGSVGTEGFDTCCNDIYSFEISSKEDTSHQVYASLDELNNYLPVVLYFHNDEPNPDTRDTTTSLTYGQAYQSLRALYNAYVKENGSGLGGDEKEESEMRVSEFFEWKVDKGVSDLNVFASLAIKELDAGKKLRVSVRGFASPRAESDYNLNLTKRRIHSLINELRQTLNGRFAPYMDATATNGGKIEFVLLPFGEYQADKSVNDDLFNDRQSIYSIGASLERKIEIQSVTYILDEPKAILTADKEVFDFGSVTQGKKAHHTFNLANTGNLTLVIDSLHSSCGCTVPELTKYKLAPGESTPLDVTFDTSELSGPQSRTITIYMAGEEPRVLTIEAHVR